MDQSSFESVGTLRTTMSYCFLKRARTVCLKRAENSRRVFEKWFNGSVIPDSRNPSPCTATAKSW